MRTYLKSPQLSGLSAATQKDRVVELIRKAILDGAFKSGERLNETHLANQLNVTRIPVREALLKLQEQGLVMNYPRRGMFVISLENEDVQRINSLRILLEAEAMKLCRINLTATIEKRLESLLEKMENCNFESDFDASNLDLEFHRTIWECSANPYLEKALHSLVTVLFAHQAITYIAAHSGRHWPLDHHRVLFNVICGLSNITPEVAMMDHLRVRYAAPERFSSLGLTQG